MSPPRMNECYLLSPYSRVGTVKNVKNGILSSNYNARRKKFSGSLVLCASHLVMADGNVPLHAQIIVKKKMDREIIKKTLQKNILSGASQKIQNGSNYKCLIEKMSRSEVWRTCLELSFIP